MAKKEKNKTNLDNDLNFDDINLDDLDSKLNIDEIDPFDRKPSFSETSKEVAKETGKGFLEGLVKKTAEKALPESYTSEYYTAIDYANFTKEVLEENKNKIERSLYNLGKEVKKILPFQLKILNNFLEKYEADKEQIAQQTEEQIREANIQSSLSSIFDKQLEIQYALKAKEEAENKVQRKQDLAINKLNIDILRSIDTNIANKTAFTLQISKEYYRKSLELQYKSYFIQLDMLKTMRDYYKGFSSQFDIIAKNTGLPDFVKLHNKEKLEEVIKTNVSQNIYKQLFNNNEYIQNVKNKFNSYLSNKVSEFTDKINTITDALSQVGIAKEMGSNSVIYNILGGLAGTTLGEKIAEKISPKLKDKIKDNKYINAGGNYLTLLGSSPSTLFQILRERVKSKKEEFEDKDDILSTLTRSGLSGIEDLLGITKQEIPDYKIKKSSILDHNKPAIFDNKVHRSITEIIPLYLSKILYEVSNLRSSYNIINEEKLKSKGYKESTELHYDYENRKLDTLENIRSKIQRSVFSTTDKGRVKLDNVKSSIILTAESFATNKEDKKKLKNKKLQESFKEYIEKAHNVLSPEEFTYENIIEKAEQNIKLKDLLDENTLEYLTLIRKNINQEGKKELDYRVRDVKNIYPINSVKELFEKVSILANSSVKNSLKDNEANIIAKALTDFIMSFKEDITINNIINGKCFTKLLNSDIDKVKTKISIFIFEVKKINSSSDIALKSSLEVLLGLVNRSLKEGININPDIFQTLYEYSPLLQEQGSLTLENLAESKLGIFKNKEYIDSNQLKEIVKVSESKIKEKTLEITKQNIIEQINESKYFKEASEAINKFKSKLNETKNPSSIIKAFRELTSDLYKTSKSTIKQFYDGNLEKLDKIKNSLNNLTRDTSQKVLETTKNTINNQLKEFIVNLDKAIKEEEIRYNNIIKSMDESITLAEKISTSNSNIENLRKDKEKTERRKETELKILNNIKEKTIFINNKIAGINTEGIDTIKFLNNIRQEINSLISEYKRISSQLETQNT